MDALADRGVVFENAVASAPVTLPSHATILTGLHPPAHGALDNGYYSLPADVPSLPDALRSRGYETAAFVGSVVLQGRYGLASRFDHYDDAIHHPRRTGQAYRERRAEEVVGRATAWMDGRDGARPFFAWLHFYDPHAPYDPPPELRERFATRPYDGEIAHADEALGRLVESLRRSGRLERTLLIVTSDHGEAFGDGGEQTHGILLRGTTLRVPLLFCAPGALPAGRRVKGTVSLADVAPTVSELLGLPPGPPADGESLVEAMRIGRAEGRLAYAETRMPADVYGWSMLAGVRSDRWAWVRAPRPELYDLREDPGETRSVDAVYPEIAAELDLHVGGVLAATREEARNALAPEEIEAFRSLGYLFSREIPEPTGADPKDMLVLLEESNWLQNLLERGETEEVVARARRLLEKDPGNSDALLALAQALDSQGLTEQAIASAREAFERGGSLDLEGTLLAMYLMKAGRIEESEALLRAFVRAEPDYAEHAYNLGNLLAQAGRFDDAIGAYESALALNPESVHILANLATALSRLPPERAERERALELIDRAIGIAVEDDSPALIKMEICARLGKPEIGMSQARELQKKRRLFRITEQDLADAIRKLAGS
jgi:arylsulfatase A-like enzyme/Tfp pilus assembly protein PilF